MHYTIPSSKRNVIWLSYIGYLLGYLSFCGRYPCLTPTLIPPIHSLMKNAVTLANVALPVIIRCKYELKHTLYSTCINQFYFVYVYDWCSQEGIILLLPEWSIRHVFWVQNIPQNAFVAGAQPRTYWRITTFPDPIDGFGAGE